MRQYPTVVLPQAGTDFETIADAAQHPSLIFPSQAFPEMELTRSTVHIFATAVAAPANLQAWIEVNPYGTWGLWVPLGVPIVFVVTGNQGMAWTIQYSYARVVLQCPLWAAGTSWVVVAVMEGSNI